MTSICVSIASISIVCVGLYFGYKYIDNTLEIGELAFDDDTLAVRN